MTQFSPFDEVAMRRALELAARGLYSTCPNPRVGAVLARDNEIVGEGWHECPGQAHAEPNALREAGERARGATAYVTLEPCSHHGRTPPCVDALLAAGVRRVVYAIGDPDPRVNGRGAKLLADAGVKVESGLMAREAEALNAGFLMRLRKGRPFVRLKSAASLDGRTALANGASKWITSEEARADVQHWRAQSGAILTSAATVLADDILDRMRANLSAVRAGDYRIADGPAYVAATGTVARFDCEEWIATLQSTLPDGGGRVEMIGAVEDGLVRIEVHWNDETEMFRTESRL